MDENPRIADLRKKLEKDPGSRLFAQLAEELRKEGRHEEAIVVAQSGLDKNPNYPSARLTLARALLDAGRLAEARPELEIIVKASPDNILAGRLLGETLDSLGEAPEALQQFERTLQLTPGDKAVHEKVAELRTRTGELSRKAASALAAPLPIAVAPAPKVLPTATVAFPSVFENEPAPPSALPSVLPPDRPAVLPSVFEAVPAVAVAPAPPPVAKTQASPAPPKLSAPAMARPPAVALKPAAPPPPASKAPAPPIAAKPPGPAVAPKVPAPALQAKAPAPPTPPAPPKAPRPAPAQAPASMAFDRDLASGTFTPGSLNVAELQRHFEAAAHAERAASLALASPTKPAAASAVSARLAEMDTADTLSLDPSAELQTMEFPALEMPADDDDIGAQTLPLTSVTLADLYLQQGLKKEASAVLSQVLRDEPDNAEAKSKFAQVSRGVEAVVDAAPTRVAEPRVEGPVVEELIAQTLPPTFLSAASEVRPKVPPKATKAEVRARTIEALRAFEGACEREGLHQRASEQRAF